jgi:hypothetical protein
MRYTASVLCAAAVSGLTVGAVIAADKGPTTAPSALHTASTAANSADTDVSKAANTLTKSVAPSPDSAIRNLLAEATNHATAGDLTDVIATLDATSQQRIDKAMPHGQSADAKLDAQVQKLNNNWKQKYGHPFSIVRIDSTFATSFISINEGSPAKNTQLANSVAKADGAGGVTTSTFADDSSIALVTIGSGKALVQTQVPLVCEKSGQWRIDAPSSLTYDSLCHNLTAQLSDANQQFAQWPANEAEAQRLISSRILMALTKQTTAVPVKAAIVTPKAATVTPAPRQTSAMAKPAAAPVSTSHWWQVWKW